MCRCGTLNITNVFNRRVLGSCSLNVFAASLSAYQTADVWKDFNPINGTLSVDNARILDALKLYPNPTKNSLFIEAGHISNAKVEVMDLLGKTYLSQLLNRGTHSINTSHLSKGVYLIKVSASEGTVLKKIIKN